MKTAVIGYSGAGKSTLSGRLAKKYHCPVLYRTKAKRLHYQNIRNRYPGKFVAFHNHKEVERWFAGQGEKRHENKL